MNYTPNGYPLPCPENHTGLDCAYCIEYRAREAAEDEHVYQLLKNGGNFGASRDRIDRMRERLKREGHMLPPARPFTVSDALPDWIRDALEHTE